MKLNERNLIYIVDDDPDDRQIILDAFLERNQTIDYVFIEDAEALLENLRSADFNYPSLIMLDLNLPGMLGLQALMEIRQHKDYRHIPIIVLTTSTLEHDKVASLEAGANCFIRKPDSYQELIEITDAVVRLWLIESRAMV